MRGARKTAIRSERTGHVEALLDDALRMTFPASDPIAPAVDTTPAEAKRYTLHDDLLSPRPDSIRKPKR